MTTIFPYFKPQLLECSRGLLGRAGARRFVLIACPGLDARRGDWPRAHLAAEIAARAASLRGGCCSGAGASSASIRRECRARISRGRLPHPPCVRLPHGRSITGPTEHHRSDGPAARASLGIGGRVGVLKAADSQMLLRLQSVLESDCFTTNAIVEPQAGRLPSFNTGGDPVGSEVAALDAPAPSLARRERERERERERGRERSESPPTVERERFPRYGTLHGALLPASSQGTRPIPVAESPRSTPVSESLSFQVSASWCSPPIVEAGTRPIRVRAGLPSLRCTGNHAVVYAEVTVP